MTNKVQKFQILFFSGHFELFFYNSDVTGHLHPPPGDLDIDLPVTPKESMVNLSTLIPRQV